jgi:homoprotocatechuate degradation regulator HpaR
MKSPSRLPPYRQSLAGNLLAAREAVMEPLRPILRRVGLTEQQWRVLRVLTDEGPNDPSGLANAGLLHPPSVARILHDLAERKLILRKSDPADGRRKMIAVTREGRALVEQTARHVVKVLELYTKEFGKKRLLSLQAELAELVRIIGEPGAPSE